MTAAGRRLGIDVGGTKCLGVILDDAGEMIEEQRCPTPKGPEAIIATLAELARSMGPWDSIGIGVPGLVTRSGVLRAAPNLVDITNFEVGRLLGVELGATVFVDNDGTCAAAAEWKTGAARGVDDFVMVTLGTGIGGGVIAGGALIRGANGFTGEIGHMVVDPDGPPCPCGRRGCWERYASGSGLARLAREAAVGRRLERVVNLAGGDAEKVRGEDVQAAAREGDADALQVIDNFGRWVALGLANLTNILDPESFVLGGGLAASADLYLGPIQKWFTQLLYAPHLRPHPSLMFAHLGERAGAVGAALLAVVH
ncbi:MAG TPA: ROK family protein [Ilumatobacteraceae bacterium]|nr:ROK family protein [Ilumatobacteraceae bacterium]